jgi:superfamily II DNA or RNA helicase
MKIEVGNVTSKVVECTNTELTFLNDLLQVSVPNHQFMPSFKSGSWDGKKSFFSVAYKSFLTGFLPFILREAAAKKIKVYAVDKRKNPVTGDPVSFQERYPKLRSYQAEALQSVFSSLRFANGVIPWQRGILKMSTGSGKTFVTACLADFLHKKTLYIVDRRNLAHQVLKEFEGVTKMSVGILGDGLYNVADITIAMIQTLKNMYKKPAFLKYLATVDLLIVDECHKISGGVYHKLMVKCPAYYRLGISGTPLARGDLGDLTLIADTGELLVDTDRSVLEREGFLAKPHVYMFPSIHPNGIGYAYRRAYRELIVANETRNALILAAVKKLLKRDCNILILVSELRHGKTLMALLKQHKIKSIYVRGEDSSDERRRALDGVGTTYKVLVASRIFDEGMNCLDPLTEVLTQRGWLKYADLKSFDMVMTMDMESGKGIWSPILRKIRRELRHGERLISFKTQHYDYLVTENHDFIVADVRYKMRHGVSKKTVGPWAKRRAFHMADGTAGRFNLPVAVDGPQSYIDLLDDEIRFIAWLYTDGGLEGHGRAVIRQSPKSPFCADIRNLLSRLGFHWTETLRTSKGFEGIRSQCMVFGIGKKQWYAKLSSYVELGGFSPRLLMMSKDQFWAFWVEAINADGSSGVKWKKFGQLKSPSLASDNEKLIDGLQALAARYGFASKKATYGYHYVLRIRDAIEMETLYSASRNNNGKRFAVSDERPEWVWCVTTETGTVVTRRKGSVLVLGNCPAMNCVIMANEWGALPVQNLATISAMLLISWTRIMLTYLSILQHESVPTNRKVLLCIIRRLCRYVKPQKIDARYAKEPYATQRW